MSYQISIRRATPADVSLILTFIRELATYEKLAHEVVAREEDFHEALFGAHPVVEAVIASLAGEPVGYALFFANFSTFLGKPGLYLEDLYVRPEARGHGAGRALLEHLAQIAVERNWGRFEWAVLDWNAPAIAFYERMGATVMPDWRLCRITGEPLARLGRAAEPRDLAPIVRLIGRLAEFEHLEHLMQATPEKLGPHLFGPRPVAEALVAERGSEVVAFALFFTNFSTFLAQPGLYLEDLFVRPSHRGRGIGEALLTRLARLAVERDYGRFEWSVLDWNEPAIRFYERMGATVMPDWRICRIAGDALRGYAA